VPSENNIFFEVSVMMKSHVFVCKSIEVSDFLIINK
jgi:hypothetical protein